ncbi:CsiV family protein [Motiliproteus sp.]|uniref:CsiV family protein n=1 Tax=Motiliproteus sp. TaxID=1898955 RepID=UPI003BA8AAAF
MNPTFVGSTRRTGSNFIAKMAALSLLVFGLNIGTLQAQQTELAAKKVYWYQVELLVFTQPANTLEAEYWDEKLRPSFDTNAIQLLSPERLRDLPNRAESATATTDGRPTPLRQEYSDGAFVLVKPSQRLKIDDDEEPIAPISRKRLRQGGHRILLDATWNQPVHDPGKNRAIAIRGGERLNNGLFELEGQLTLSLARFLHLHPNLFLSRPLPADWQPRHPAALTPATSVSDPVATTAEATDLNAETDSNSIAINSQTIPTQPSESAEINTDGYLTTRLDQPRRMRRNELHYLDHPQFGLLIRLTPIEPPSAQAVIEAPAETVTAEEPELSDQSRG